MQALATALLPANPVSFGNRKAALPAHSSGPPGESFDALMARALAPSAPDKNTSAAPDGQAGATAPGTEKTETISTHKPQRPVPAPSKATKETDSVEPDAGNSEIHEKSGAPTDGNSDAKTGGDNSDKTADAPVLVEASVVPDNSQNISIPMPAPALAACLLTAFAPATDGKTVPTTDVSVLPMEGATSKKEPVGALTAIAATAKNSAPVTGAATRVEVLTNQPATEAVPGLKPEEQKIIAGLIKMPAAQKTIPSDTKVAGITTASVETATSGAETFNAKSAEAVTGDLLPPKISEGAGEPLPPSKISAEPDFSKETAATTSFQIHGTSDAKQTVPMKTEDNTNKVAGLGEKVLPSNVVSLAREKILPGRGASVVPFSAGAAATDSSAAASSLASGQAVAATTSSSNTLVSSNVIDLPARAVERTHDMVALHALRLVDAQSDSLHVVIKPGAGMQLSLELRQRGDGIEAQAVLQLGDFNQMNQHWSDLQQRLEQRGIRLAPLAGDENPAASGGWNEFQHQEQRQPEEPDPLVASAFAEFALAGAMTAPAGHPALFAVAQRGWQSWA